jgi:hypothetical protein
LLSLATDSACGTTPLQVVRTVFLNASQVAFLLAFKVDCIDFWSVDHVDHAALSALPRATVSDIPHASWNAAFRVTNEAFVADCAVSTAPAIAVSRASTAVCMHIAFTGVLDACFIIGACMLPVILAPFVSANAADAKRNADTIAINATIPALIENCFVEVIVVVLLLVDVQYDILKMDKNVIRG